MVAAVETFFRSKARIVASFGQPLLFLLAFGFGFGPVFSRAGQGNYIQFLAPGVIGMSVLFTAIFAGIELIWDRQFGFLKETLVAPVPRILIMLGRTLGGATVAVMQGILYSSICLLVGFRPVTLAMVPLALLYMLLMALMFTAVGTALGSAMTDFQGFQLVMNFLVMPIFFLSGALFPLTNVPRALAHRGRHRPALLQRRRPAPIAHRRGAFRSPARCGGPVLRHRGRAAAGRLRVLEDSGVNVKLPVASAVSPSAHRDRPRSA